MVIESRLSFEFLVLCDGVCPCKVFNLQQGLRSSLLAFPNTLVFRWNPCNLAPRVDIFRSSLVQALSSSCRCNHGICISFKVSTAIQSRPSCWRFSFRVWRSVGLSLRASSLWRDEALLCLIFKFSPTTNFFRLAKPMNLGALKAASSNSGAIFAEGQSYALYGNLQILHHTNHWVWETQR